MPKTNSLFVGCALSDANRADLPNALRVPERLADYARRFQERVGTTDFSFELQPEDLWTRPVAFPDEFVASKTNRWWRAIRQNADLAGLLRGHTGSMGVHQPILGRNPLSSNFFGKYQGIAETQQAMAFAHAIDADYFVFHLATEDAWGWERRDQMAKALKLYSAFAAFANASSFTFVPCIELVEYPKFPATGGEAVDLLSRCREIWPETQLVFDVSHLWGTRNRMLAAGQWQTRDGAPVTFLEALEYGLEQTWCDVYVYHLGGCWESETHAIPGLHPQQDPFHYPLKLRESSSVYAEMGEIDLNRTLDLLLQYSVGKDRPLRLMLEIFDRDIDQVLEATRLVREDLSGRAETLSGEKRTRVPKASRARASLKPRSRKRAAETKKVKPRTRARKRA